MFYSVRSVGVPGYIFSYELIFAKESYLTEAIYCLLLCEKHKHTFLVDTRPGLLRMECDQDGTECIAWYVEDHGHTLSPAPPKATPPFPLFLLTWRN